MKHEETNDKENEPQRKTFENNPDYINFKEQKVSVLEPPDRKTIFVDLAGDPNAVYAEMILVFGALATLINYTNVV
jgi:hypothetical protein